MAWLRTRPGWTVYQEVDTPMGRCDIVAQHEDSGAVHAIECKVRLSWEVIRQAWRWRHLANWVSVATLPRQRPDDAALGDAVLRSLGIGWLAVSDRVTERLAAVRRVALDGETPVDIGLLREYLRPEQQHFAPAGNSRGDRFTTFKGTVRAIEAYVREHPRCTADDLYAGVPHHYRDPKVMARELKGHARGGRLGAVEVYFDGKRPRFVVGDAPEVAAPEPEPPPAIPSTPCEYAPVTYTPRLGTLCQRTLCFCERIILGSAPTLPPYHRDCDCDATPA